MPLSDPAPSRDFSRGGATASGLVQQQQKQRHQSTSRCVARLRMWLRALADVAPEVPILATSGDVTISFDLDL